MSNEAIDKLKEANRQYLPECDIADARFLHPIIVKDCIDQAIAILEKQPDLEELKKDFAHEVDMAAQANVSCVRLEAENIRLREIFDSPNHEDSKERYLYEIRVAIKLLRQFSGMRGGGEYAMGASVQLDNFYKRARQALNTGGDPER